jgi:hypothetical protein
VRQADNKRNDTNQTGKRVCNDAKQQINLVNRLRLPNLQHDWLQKNVRCTQLIGDQTWQSMHICKLMASKANRPMLRTRLDRDRLSSLGRNATQEHQRIDCWRAYGRAQRTPYVVPYQAGRPCITGADAALLDRQNDPEGQAGIHAGRR